MSPRPRQLQLLHIARADLSERAVTPGLVIPPDHKPVTGIGIAQHLIADGDVVLYLATDGQALGTGGGDAGSRPAVGLNGNRRPSGGDRADADIRRRRQGLVPGGRSVRRQDECGEIEGALFTECGIARRHGGLDVLHQIAAGAGPPGGHEIGPGELWRFISTHVHRMAI